MEIKKQKLKVKDGVLILFFAVVLVGGYFITQGGTVAKVKIPWPYTLSVENSTSFACKALVSASVIGSPEESLTNGIEGSVENGTDEFSMSIQNEETLVFLTRASLNIGVTQGTNFTILQNDKEKLHAVFADWNGLDAIILNKKTGLGLWSHNYLNYPLYNAPSGQVVYMICR